MSVTLSLFAGAGAQFLDDSGNVLTGGLIYTYSAGTTTPLATYTSNLGNTPHPNPIVLNAAGRIPTGELWLTTGLGYKFVLKDSNDVLIATYDNVPSSAQPPILNDASSIAYEQGAPTTAGSFVIGDTYLITSIGTTNFQSIGAASNTVGIYFIATGVGSGTGTAQYSRTVQSKLQESVSVKDFGAVGDGVTDDTVAIQNAIDWVTYKYQPSGSVSGGSVYMPGGIYKITNTIQLGYGTSFHCVHLYGDGKRTDSSSVFSGTGIIATFNDRPALAVNCSAGTTIKSLSISGQNRDWVLDNLLGTNGVPVIDDLISTNWVDPSFPASSSSRYAPYCAIAIDPYTGAQPAVSYPNVTFPSWSGITTQYGKFPGTDTVIEDVTIDGFVIGVVVQPSQNDTNADFVKILQSRIQYCQYAVSVCSQNSRLVRVSNCIIFNIFTAIVTAVNGAQIGKPAILVDSTEIDLCIYMINIPTTSRGGGLEFLNCHSESIYSIGFVGSGTASSRECPVVFESCEWNFDSINRGVPPAFFTNNGNSPITFIGCQIGNFGASKLIPFIGNSEYFNFQNCLIVNNNNSTKFYEKQVINATNGVVFSNAATNVGLFSVNTSFRYNLNTGAAVGNNLTNTFSKITSRQTCASIYAKTLACASFESADGGFNVYNVQNLIDKSLTASISTSGRTVTVDLTGAIPSVNSLIQGGGDVGDYYVDGSTNTVFFVASRTGNIVTLIADNNYDASGNLLSPIASSGYIYAVNCRLFTFNFVTNGTYTSGNPTITAVARPDGFDGYINDANDGVQANDYLWVGNGLTFSPVSAANSRISSIGTGTITLAGNLTISTTARQTLFVRQSPANNT